MYGDIGQGLFFVQFSIKPVLPQAFYTLNFILFNEKHGVDFELTYWIWNSEPKFISYKENLFNPFDKKNDDSLSNF